MFGFSEAVICPQLQYFIYVRFLFIILKRKAIDFESFLSDARDKRGYSKAACRSVTSS